MTKADRSKWDRMWANPPSQLRIRLPKDHNHMLNRTIPESTSQTSENLGLGSIFGR